MTQGYIFDYGGTLDTHGCHWGKVLWHAYQHCEVPVTEAAFREAYVYAERTLGKNPIIQPDFTFRQTLETKVRLQTEYLELHKRDGSPCVIRDYTERIVPFVYQQTLVETARSREVLLHLKEHYPIVLVSNFYGNISTVLHEFGLDGIFQTIIESAVVGVRKPDSRIFTLGVEAMGLRPEDVVVVGDSIDKDIIPAQQAGCQTVWFKGEGWTDDPVDETVPDRVISDLEELLLHE